MHVELLTIGNEILSGVIVDTNAAWLFDRLYERGVLAERKTTVLDDLDAIAEALRAAAARGADLVVACGGLGPTEDDLTGEAAALAAGVPFERHPEGERAVREAMARRGLEATPRQLTQADLPAGCEILPNPRGTAPGFALSLGRTRCVFLPGPPREFRPLVDEAVLPWVDARVAGGEAFAALTVRTFGQTESGLADRVRGSGLDFTDVELGYRVLFPEIHLRLRARGAAPDAARARVERAAADLEAALSPWAYARDDASFPEHVGQRLVEAGKTLALAESCTGGLAAKALTDVPGASRYLLLSAVTYADAAKTAILGVPEALLRTEGAVSEATAAAMAEGARRVSGADLAVAITGIAGPEGGSEDKPVGTVWFALARPEGTLTRTRVVPGDREQVRTLSAWFALDMVRRQLMGLLERAR